VKPEVKPQEQKPQQPQQEASHEAEISELMSMGFPREQCVEALRAAFFNVERAVEYLINGIPANVRPPPSGQGQQPVPEAEGGAEGEGGSGPEQLRAIFNSPQLASIRQLLRQNPAALQPILAQLAQSAPPLYNVLPLPRSSSRSTPLSSNRSS
jgi:UV excision repair protein RAD23